MSLNGWDMVSALRVEMINQALEADRDRLPMQFDFAQDGDRIRGALGPWQIRAGDTGPCIRFCVRSGSFQPADGPAVCLSGLRPQIPAEIALETSGTHNSELVLRAATGPREIARSRITQLLQDWIAAVDPPLHHVLGHVAARRAAYLWDQTPHLDWSSFTTRTGDYMVAIVGAAKRPARGAARPAWAAVPQLANAAFGLSPTIMTAPGDVVARRLAASRSGAVGPVVWCGTRQFQPSEARFDQCMWFCDTRPI